MDPDNPTCPRNPNWSNYREMRFTPQEVNGRRVLLAEGMIDDNLIPRLQAALQRYEGDEIWLRSPGGNARDRQPGRAGSSATTGLTDPHSRPAGPASRPATSCSWAASPRFVDPGGLFIVHMFTHTGDREAIRSEVAQGEENTVSLIGEIEQQSALLASEDNDFLIRMGVSRAAADRGHVPQSAVADNAYRSTRRCLTQEEVRRYNVVNQ